MDQFLSGEEDPAPAAQMLPAESRKDFQDMLLRVVVDSSDGDKVRVNLPLVLVETLLESGVEISGFSKNAFLKNLDLHQILDLVRQGVVGNLVEVDSADGDVVRIFVE